MKFTACLLILPLLVLALTARAATPAAVPEGIGLYGNLSSATGQSTALPLSLVFRLYDSARPKVALWGRRISVKIETTGDFYVELRDDVGVSVMDKPVTLASAMAKVTGQPEIGLTPPDAVEFVPRFTLATAPRAQRAATAKSVRAVETKGTVYLGTVQANRVAVSNDLAATSALLENVRISLGSGSTTLGAETGTESELLGGIRGIHENYWSGDAVSAESATVRDRIDTFQSTDGLLFAFPMPKGARLKASTARRIRRQTFGR